MRNASFIRCRVFGAVYEEALEGISHSENPL
jgi:hypothetical protein